jgi:hypothetical protein
MNVERAFTYPFDDEEWLKKILIAGVISVVPIANFAGWGYALQAAKNIIQGRETPLPEWDDFGEYFVKGLLTFLALLIYAIPLLLLSCVMGFFDNLIAGGRVGEAARITIGLMSFCLGLLSFLYGLLIDFVLPAATTKYVLSEQFSDFFRFGEIFSYIGNNLGNYVIAFLITLVVSIVAALAGSLACLVGLLFTIPWAMLIVAHLYAQVYNQSAQPGASDEVAA